MNFFTITTIFNMKKIILIFTLLCTTVSFSSNSFGEWKYVASSDDGTSVYIDFDLIRKHDGYVYFWALEDLLKPDQDGDMSYINYYQCDCNIFRFKHLSASYYKQAMGNGTVKNVTNENPEWIQVTPNTIMKAYLELVCSL